MEGNFFLFTDQVSLTASGTGTATFKTDVSWSFKAYKIWITSTSTFNIEDIEDTSGRSFTNASASDPIKSTGLFKPQTAGEGVGNLPVPLTVEAGLELKISLLDTSGSANVVNIYIEGEKVPV